MCCLKAGAELQMLFVERVSLKVATWQLSQKKWSGLEQD